MSVQHLLELGKQIVRATEGDPLQTEIALIALESIHERLVASAGPVASEQDLTMVRSGSIMDHSTLLEPNQMFSGNSIEFPFGQDDPWFPTIHGPQYNPEIYIAAQNVRFLFHKS
jgi:hypothetical protein